VAFWSVIRDSTVILQVLFPGSLIRLALLQGFSMALASRTAALSSAALVKEGKGRWPCRSPLVCARVVCQHLCCE